MEDTKELPQIELTPVESSQIAAIGHDPDTNTLAIQFRRHGKNADQPGAVYHYANFTAEQFDAFKGAESIGSHFGQHIKPAADKHPFTRIG